MEHAIHNDNAILQEEAQPQSFMYIAWLTYTSSRIKEFPCTSSIYKTIDRHASIMLQESSVLKEFE